jgi:ElaB/YqjD/DUF883 family membrane-anchored ribosome-binding protein
MSKIEESATAETLEEHHYSSSEPENHRSRARETAAHFMQDGKAAAQRWGRHTLQYTTGVAGKVRERVDHNPRTSVGISFLIGCGVGALIGWAAARRD